LLNKYLSLSISLTSIENCGQYILIRIRFKSIALSFIELALKLDPMETHTMKNTLKRIY